MTVQVIVRDSKPVVAFARGGQGPAGPAGPPLPTYATPADLPASPLVGAVGSLTSESAIVRWNGQQWQRHFTRNWLENQPGFDITDPVAVTTCIRVGLTEGRPIEVRSGVEYPVIGRCGIYNNSGLVCDGPVPATFLMKTGAGQFDNTDYNSAGANNRCFLAAGERTGIKIHGIDFRLEANAGIRTAFPIGFVICTHTEIDGVRLYNFKEQDGGYIRVGQSLFGNYQNILGYDCTANTTSLSRMQLTVLEETGGSFGCRFRNIEGRNVRIGATARDHYNGSQSDVLNIQTAGNAGFIIDDVFGYQVGEVLDHWASNCRISNARGQDVDHNILKLIYGASFNSVNGVSGNGTGLSAVFVSVTIPTSERPQPPKDNDIRGIDVTNVGSLWASVHQPNGQSMHSGIQVEGDQQATAANKPSGNRFEGRVNGYSPAVMPSVFYSQDAGTSSSDTNHFRGSGRNYIGTFSGYTGATAPVVTQE